MSRISIMVIGIAFALCGGMNMVRELTEFHRVGAFLLMLFMCVFGVLITKFGYTRSKDEDEEL